MRTTFLTLILCMPLLCFSQKQDRPNILIISGDDEWAENRSWLFGPAAMQVGTFVKSFEKYPPRQPSFSPFIGDLTTIINKFAASSRKSIIK